MAPEVGRRLQNAVRRGRFIRLRAPTCLDDMRYHDHIIITSSRLVLESSQTRRSLKSLVGKLSTRRANSIDLGRFRFRYFHLFSTTYYYIIIYLHIVSYCYYIVILVLLLVFLSKTFKTDLYINIDIL